MAYTPPENVVKALEKLKRRKDTVVYKRPRDLTQQRYNLRAVYPRGGALVCVFYKEPGEHCQRFVVLARSKSLSKDELYDVDSTHDLVWMYVEPTSELLLYRNPRLVGGCAYSDVVKKEFFNVASEDIRLLSERYSVKESDIGVVAQGDLSERASLLCGVVIRSFADEKKIARLVKEKTSINARVSIFYPDEECVPIVQAASKGFVERVSYAAFNEAISSRVLGQPELTKVTLGVYSYLSNIGNGRISRANVMIAGSSGTGKTETIRAIKDYLNKEIPNMPVIVKDMSAFTASGYRGRNTSDLLCDIKKSCPEGYGIVYLDEIDKRLRGGEANARGYDYGEAFQSELLTILEGCMDNGTDSFDTTKVMFILGGSFDGIRKSREEAQGKPIGFNSEKRHSVTHYSPISRSEIVEAGALPELMGRIPILVNYEPLSDEAIIEIVRRKIASASESLGLPIVGDEGFYKSMVLLSRSKFGARVFDEEILETAYEACAKTLIIGTDVDKARIVLKGNKQYEVEQSEE